MRSFVIRILQLWRPSLNWNNKWRIGGIHSSPVTSRGWSNCRMCFSPTASLREHNIGRRMEGMFRYQQLFRLAGREYRNNFSSKNVRLFASAADMKAQFDAAAERVKQLGSPGQENLLKLYALFKQGSVGDNATKKPSAIDFVGSAKWKAWTALAGMSKEEAQKGYVELVNELAGASQAAKPTSAPSSASSATDVNAPLLKEISGKIFKITFNRPEKRNAITREMYDGIINALDEAGKADTLLTVFTGAGDFYCSGNDLSNFSISDIKELPQMAAGASVLLKRYIASYIDHPKPLVALVNGPAIGISTTVLGMFDLVYASDKATFETPFGRLAQAPEGCSTFTYPRLMGLSKATEVLFFNRKLTAEDALRCGLVNEVFPSSNFAAETARRLESLSQLPPQNIIVSRKLIRDQLRKELHHANEIECKLSEERWQSKEAIEAIMKFFSKSKM